MLPNFRKPDQDAARPATAPTLTVADASKSFPARPIMPAGRSDRAAVSVIGPDLTITGNLVSKGEVQIEGIIDGDIHGSHVIVGQQARVNGGILAEEVVVRGHVVGSVKSKRVMLQASSQVEGDIYHNAISIEEGAMFEGKSRRTNDDPRTVQTHSGSAPHAFAPPVPKIG